MIALLLSTIFGNPSTDFANCGIYLIILSTILADDGGVIKLKDTVLKIFMIMLIHQLVYSSTSAKEVTDSLIYDIMESVKIKNYPLRISGALIYHKGRFMQLLEGEKDAVNSMFASILRDSRHTNIKLELKTENAARLMGMWAMGFSTDEGLLSSLDDQNFYIPSDSIKEMCERMPESMGQLFLRFLAS